MSKGKRILVTGAGGFVGAAIAKAALESGHEVIALVRSGAARLAPIAKDISIERADLADRAAVRNILLGCRPDVVIHSAWEGVGGALRSSHAQLDNILTTVALAEAAVAAGANKFVGIGSQAEYGRYDRRIVETDLPEPTMLYGAAKLASSHLAAQRCRDAGIAFAWLRLFSVYGPGDNPNWLIPHAAAALIEGKRPALTRGVQKWDYLHIDDVASGVLAASMTNQATGVFNLASGQPVAVRSIIETMRDMVAPGLQLTFGDVPYGPDQIMHLEGDNSRLRQATGWSPRVPLATGLREVVDRMRIAA